MPGRHDWKIRPWPVLLLLALGLAGCTGTAPPSPQAALFKKDLREIIAKLAPALGGPVAKEDGQAAAQAVLAVYPDFGQEGSALPFKLGILDRNGILLATVPPVQAATGADFAKYQLVQETVANRRIGTSRLYAPDGRVLLLIAAPIVAGDHVVGILGLSLPAALAEARWGITEKEFLALNLN